MEASDRDRIFERAGDVGRLLSQAPEYGYLRAAMRDIDGDEEAKGQLDRIRELQEKLIGFLERDLGTRSEEMQASSRYQSLISAQANFDRLMEKVNQAIARGLKEGEKSRIILPS